MKRPRVTLPSLNPRRRLRDRLLVAMLVVALLPLGVFSLLMAVNLDSVTRTTVSDTRQTIIDDQKARIKGLLASSAESINTQLTLIERGVRSVHDELIAIQSEKPGPAALSLSSSGVFSQSSPDNSTSLIVGAAPAGTSQPPQVRATRLSDPNSNLVKAMQRLRDGYPQIQSVWAADLTGGAMRIVPGLADVGGAVATGRIDARSPLGRGVLAMLTASRSRMQPSTDRGAWPLSHPDPITGPFWTEPHPTVVSDNNAVTVWVGDAGLLVAADIDVATFASLLPQVSTDANAYPLLLSSGNTVIASGDTGADFGAPPRVGGLLALPPSPSLGDRIKGLVGGGRAGDILVPLGAKAKLDKFLFGHDVDAPHWMLMSAVPRSDLEPDITGLTKGIDNGVRRIFLETIPVLVILVLFAFLLATLIARRMVGPVRALTLSAERLAEGHTDEAVPPQGSDEVGDLAASLERMRREINSSRDAILAASRELEQRVAVRTSELRSRNEELVALNELAGSLTRSLDPGAILDGALEAVRAILPVSDSRGFVLDDDGRLAAMGSTGGPDERLEEVAASALTERRLVTRRDGRGVLIGLPMATRGGQLGALGLLSPAVPGGEMAALLMAIANQVGLALRTARLSAEGREVAVLEERTRLAREIHDTLAQQLTGIVIQLEAAQALVGRDSGRAQQTLVTARDLARSALQEARRSVWDLRPAPLAATGVVAAVELEVERFRERTEIPARMRAEGMSPPPALQPQAEVAILRITQQALANIADHSGATRVNLRLAHIGSEVELSIRDNGRGFDPDAEHHGSFGIVGMSERARLAGGTLEVDSAPQRGTSIRVRLPVAVETERVPA